MTEGRIRREEGQPFDRLGRLCAAMAAALDAHPERGDEKCIVFLQNGDRSGYQLHGYEDDAEAVVDLLTHLRAMFNAQGKELVLVPIKAGNG